MNILRILLWLREIIVDELFIIYVNNEVIVNKINYAKEGPTGYFVCRC